MPSDKQFKRPDVPTDDSLDYTRVFLTLESTGEEPVFRTLFQIEFASGAPVVQGDLRDYLSESDYDNLEALVRQIHTRAGVDLGVRLTRKEKEKEKAAKV